MTDVLKQFEEFRESLIAEYHQLEAEIAQRFVRKREIERALLTMPDQGGIDHGLAGQVLAFIQVSPDGVNRAQIAEGIEFDGNLKYLTNVLGTLKDRGKIRREGNKIGSVWFPVINGIE